MKDKKVDEDKLCGFLDEGAVFDGTMKFSGSFRIDGEFKGKIEANAVLIIGPKGKVEAELNVSHVVVNGSFTGNIKSSEKVEVNREGRVVGTITAPKLVVEEGAYLDAQCQTAAYEGAVARESGKTA
jgi:cytoskeletal protein CcmA (bactofilin family)